MLRFLGRGDVFCGCGGFLWRVLWWFVLQRVVVGGTVVGYVGGVGKGVQIPWRVRGINVEELGGKEGVNGMI